MLTEEETKIVTAFVDHICQTKYTNCNFSAADIIKFLRTVRGNPNKRQLAENLTNNIDCLLFTLEEIKPRMEAGTKQTITSLIKALTTEEQQSDLSDL